MNKIKFFKKPNLRNPYLICAWPGMGQVAYRGATFLVDKLKAEEFAEIPNKDFFYLTGSTIKEGILDITQPAQNKFYYWKNKNGKNDLIIFVDKILEVWNSAYKAMQELDKLVEVAFSGIEAKRVLEIISKTEHLEWEADCCQLELAKKLFRLEGKISPVDIMLWFKIFDEMGTLANHCEKTADRLRRFLSK